MVGAFVETARITPVSLPLASPRAISRGTETHALVVEVELTGRGCVGRGQACPMPRYGESMDGVVAAFGAAPAGLTGALTREGLMTALPAGALRNAVDCALWDLECAQSGVSAETLAGLSPGPITTAFTIPLLPPVAAGVAATRERHRPVIKLKLGHFADDAGRLMAVRVSAPDARLIVDANEGWSFDELREIAPLMAELNVQLVEQPLPAAQDAVLATFKSPIPLCADESCHTRGDLARMVGRYEFVNIKLDKTGGLTEALLLAEEAKRLGLRLMVGSTSATTLAIAPAFLVAQLCELADLDAALFLAAPEQDEIAYDGSTLTFSPTRRWGA